MRPTEPWPTWLGLGNSSKMLDSSLYTSMSIQALFTDFKNYFGPGRILRVIRLCNKFLAIFIKHFALLNSVCDMRLVDELIGILC